jgi:hypothetical protein
MHRIASSACAPIHLRRLSRFRTLTVQTIFLTGLTGENGGGSCSNVRHPFPTLIMNAELLLSKEPIALTGLSTESMWISRDWIHTNDASLELNSDRSTLGSHARRGSEVVRTASTLKASDVGEFITKKNLISCRVGAAVWSVVEHLAGQFSSRFFPRLLSKIRIGGKIVFLTSPSL